jgi:hypothetical protein
MDAHVYRPQEIPGSILRQLYGLNLGYHDGAMYHRLLEANENRATERCVCVVMDGTRVLSWAIIDTRENWIHVYTRRSERKQGHAHTALTALVPLAPKAKHVYSRRVAFKKLLKN